MAKDRALVENAADFEQVKNATRLERNRVNDFALQLAAALEVPEARFVFWTLLGRARVHGSVFARDPYVTAYNSGRQDFGHELMAEIIASSPEGYLRMEQEARARGKRDAATVDAAHTTSADPKETSTDT